MAIEWSEDLATGASVIDEQHRELFRRINALIDACRLGKGRDEVMTVVDFLDAYVESHFGEEEAYMQLYGYPGRDGHVAEHRVFVTQFNCLKKELEADGPGLSIVIRTNELVVQWLRDHIRKVDKLLGGFLRDRLPAQTTMRG